MRSQAQQAQARKDAPATGRFDARGVLQALSKPRLTGTPEAAEITNYVRGQLTALGYEVREHPFSFSTWPGRFGVSAAGAVFLLGALFTSGLLYAGHPGVALVLHLVVLVLIMAIAVLAKPLMQMLPWGRAQASNLMAHKAGSRPRYFVMAHRDSKSQPVPLAFRGPAIVLGIIAWIAMLLACALGLLDPVYNRSDIALIIGAVSVVAGAILIFCWVENRSPGALDNASGVATLLGVAEAEAAAGDVAFVVTDAEELGLVGARMIAPLLPPSFGVINIDGIDDEGGYFVIERFGFPKKTGAAPHLAAALLHAADEMNTPARRRDVPVGLLVDHIPVVKAGTPAVTLMRGTLGSLRRVHRPADNLDRLKGTGVTATVTLLSKALTFLRSKSTD